MNLQVVNQRQQVREDRETGKVIRDFNRSELGREFFADLTETATIVSDNPDEIQVLLRVKNGAQEISVTSARELTFQASIDGNGKTVAAMKAGDRNLTGYWEIQSLAISTDRGGTSGLVADSDYTNGGKIEVGILDPGVYAITFSRMDGGIMMAD